MTRRLAAAALAALLAVGACTTTEPEEEAGDPGTTVSTTAGDEPPPPTTTTTGPPADCPPPGVGSLPTDGQDLSEALGDFDGNGSVDQLFVYSTRSGRMMRIVLSSGFGTEIELDASRGRAVGGFPMGEGGDLALAVVGSGATTQLVGLYAFRDCTIVPVTLPDGGPAEFSVGGSVGEGHGLECKDGQLIEMTARSRDGRTYTSEQIVWRLDGTTLREVRRAEGATLDNRTAEPLVRLHYQLTCGTLGLGPSTTGR